MKTALTELAWPVLKLLISVLVVAALYFQTERLETAHQLLAYAQQELVDERAAAKSLAAMLDARQAIDSQRTEELNRAYQDNQDLQRAVADGRRRLLVKATCSRPAVPAATAAAGVVDAATSELTSDARSDYFTLRDQLALSEKQTQGLQDYVTQVCLRTPAKP